MTRRHLIEGLAGVVGLALAVAAIALVSDGKVGVAAPETGAVPWDACPDVDVDTSPAIAAPRWESCGAGCVQLVPEHGLYGVAGASDGVHRLLGYGRDLGATQDLIVTELGAIGPEHADRVAFTATMTRGFHGCMARLRGMTSERALVELSTREGGERRRVLAEVASDARARVISDDASERGAILVATSELRRAITRDRRTLEMDGRVVWTAPDGALITQLAIGYGAVFASTADAAGGSTLWAWTPGAGAVVLRDGAGAPAVGTGQLVWRERQGDAVAVMIAPATATPDALRGRVVATLPADAAIAAVEHVVGGGRIVALDRRGDARRLLVIDIDTGAIATPAAPGALRWSAPLWSDRDELAVVADAPADAYRRGELASGASFTVIRLEGLR